MSIEDGPFKVKIFNPATAFEYTAIHIDTDGHSLMARAGTGGNPWLTWTEQIKGMLSTTTTITEWAVNGRAISQMNSQLAGQARPAKPATTLVCRVSTETINEIVLVGSTMEATWSLIEQYCLAVKALNYYQRHFYIANTPGGYNGLGASHATINTRLAAGVTTNVQGANPIGTTLGITFVDLMALPEFAANGLKRGTHPCDVYAAPDVTNLGGIGDYEFAHNYDWSGVHFSSNGHSLVARLVAESLNATTNAPLVTATSFTMEKRNAAGTYVTVAGTVIDAVRGEPLVLRARSLVGGVATPTLHACLWRNDAFGDSAADLTGDYVPDPGIATYYPKTDAGVVAVRCGRVNQNYTLNWLSGEHMPHPHIQRMRHGWNTAYNVATNAHIDSDLRFVFDGESGSSRIVTTTGFVVGERVVSWTDSRFAAGLQFTVPGGSVGPYLRSKCLTSFPVAPESNPRTIYYLEFDSASAKLQTPLSALNELTANYDLYITGRFTNATGVAPIMPVKVHNAGDTQVWGMDTSQTGWRVYRKTGALDSYSTAVGDRLTTPANRTIKIYKWYSAVDGFPITRLTVQGQGLETSVININPNYTAENLYLTLGGTGVSYMEVFALGGARGVAHDIDWFYQNEFLIHGS